MSDVLGASTGTSQTNQLDLLVQSYRQTQQSKLDALTNKENSLATKRNFMSSLNSKIGTMVSVLDTFGSFKNVGKVGSFTKTTAIDSKFQARSSTSSDKSILSATAKEGALLSSNSIFVERLAMRDSLVSSQVALSGAFGVSGSQTFSLKVNDVSYDINVAFDGTETNQQAINKIATAINGVKDIKATSSLIKDTPATGRFTINSTDSGADFRIQFTDSPVLEKLGITNSAMDAKSKGRTVATDTSAGFMKADYSELNAKVKINGISIYRNSNTIDDALDNVSLTLNKAQASTEQPVSVSTGIDSASVESLIKPLLSAYNDIVNFVNSNTNIKRQEAFVSSISSQLRNIMSQSISGTSGDDPKFLMDIGIKVSDAGTISIADSTKLSDALKKDPQKVANLFTAPDGMASKINSALQNMTGDKGILTSRTQSLNNQIDASQKQTIKAQDRIDQQAALLKKQYTAMLKSYYEAQGQYQWFTSATATTA